MSLVLSIENVSKMYRLGVIGTGTLHADLSRWWAQARGRPDPALRIGQAERTPGRGGVVWALREVTAGVSAGETVGIIGRNGAGKSTLLKILSRVTAPTSGHVKLKGRVASLLEVGTGFHPELTGRENVYLNGAILGMSRAEIKRKFEAIVAFADVGPFIDTPVKRYSSGMHVRLAFAVAAHLEPDILIVDEVLAVGDAEFQKKCLGKMQDLTQSEQRTVLFVSHNMGSIKALCQRAVLLDNGRVMADGDVESVVARYVQGHEPPASGDIAADAPSLGTGEARFRRVEIQNTRGERISQVFFGQPFRVVFDVEALKDLTDVVFEVDVSTLDGTYVTTSLSIDGARPPAALPLGVHRIAVELRMHLMADRYTIDLGVHHTGPPWTIDFVRRTLDFEALNVSETGADRYVFGVKRGYVRPESHWHLPVAAS
jgi:lipopolysaccharide transport system ATP-binding protein